MNRKVIILSCLFVVGLTSFAASIYTDPGLSTQQALLSLGTEGLKTAVLFVLVDYLIGDHEKQKEDRGAARRELNLAIGDLGSGIDDYLDRLEENGAIRVTLSSKHSFSGQAFKKRKFLDTSWNAADFSRAEFSKCEFGDIHIERLSFRGAIFEDVKFKNTKFARVDLSRSLFVNCRFESSDLSGAICSETRFSSCHFFAMGAAKFPRSGAEYDGCIGVPKDAV